jgi:hypothetical protein
VAYEDFGNLSLMTTKSSSYSTTLPSGFFSGCSMYTISPSRGPSVFFAVGFVLTMSAVESGLGFFAFDMSSVTRLWIERQHSICVFELYAHAFGRLFSEGFMDGSGWFEAASPVISSVVMASLASAKEAAGGEVDMVVAAGWNGRISCIARSGISELLARSGIRRIREEFGM